VYELYGLQPVLTAKYQRKDVFIWKYTYMESDQITVVGGKCSL